ncbi:hypothetical protein [Variovorax sp. GB1P17]|uniref:hypothetical protein n=1 Tax=Variovorax sp. GB1P17 TaxID=3443740 RepID=UPI003F476484
MTRVYFQSDSIPKFAAKRLKYGLAIPQAKAELWTAQIFNYRDWHDMLNMLGRQEPTLLDEHIPPSALQERREFQAQALRTCFSKDNFAYFAPTVLAQWQPSAARPGPYAIDLQAPSALNVLAQWKALAAQGVADYAFRLAWVLAPDGPQSRHEPLSAVQEEATLLYRQAAEAEHVEAMFNLGLFMLPRVMRLDSPEVRATTWLHRAGQLGDSRAKAYEREDDDRKEDILNSLLAGTLEPTTLSAQEDAWIRGVWRRPYF